MYSLFIALGSAAPKLAHRDLREVAGIDANSESTVVRIDDEFIALISVPKGSGPALVCGEPGQKFKLLVDGYISVGDRSEDTNNGALSKLSDSMQERGVASALTDVVTGSYNMVCADARTKEIVIATDAFGSIPLYYAMVDGGLVASTSPRSIVATGLIPDSPDWVGCASWLYFGYTIGNRFLSNDIRIFPSGSFLTWKNGQSNFHHLGIELHNRLPDVSNPSTSGIAESMRNACERLARVEGSTAHLQSAGMDSRLILAAWPDGQNPPCFTYGREDSTELYVARRIAKVRGSTSTHFLPDGDSVADSLDSMFRSNGLMVYADRYLISKRIQEGGYNNILDGFQGGVYLGGGYYKCDTQFAAYARLARYATIFRDLSISRIGLSTISTTLAKSMFEIGDLRDEFPFLSEDFVQEIEKRRPYLLEDIENECKRLTPENDSLALLYRSFFQQNRGLHAIAQQGVMCRSFLRPLYPFTNDREVMNESLRLTPESGAYRRFFIRLFRNQFPEYAEIEYGDSMIALKHSPLTHGAYKFLARGEEAIFGKGNGKLKLPVSPNNWSTWLRNSGKLRDKLSADLLGSNIVDTARLDTFVTDLQSGARVGNGKLFHLASIAKWLS